MCMFICMHVCTHMCVCVCGCMCIFIRTYECMYAYKYVCMYVCPFVYRYIYMGTLSCIYKHPKHGHEVVSHRIFVPSQCCARTHPNNPHSPLPLYQVRTQEGVGVPEALLGCGHVLGDQSHDLTADEERRAPPPLRSKGEDDPLLEQGGGVGPTHKFLAPGRGGGSEISECSTRNPLCMIKSYT